MTAPRVVHSVACLDAETGGTAQAVPALVRALEAATTPASLVTRRPRAGGHVPALPSRVTFTRRGRWRGVGEFTRALETAAGALDATLLHDHGIWLPTNHASARAAKRLGLPRVVTPHGMLDPWALGWHAVRKRVAWRLYQRRDLAEAAMLHATSLPEARAIRALGLHQPIAVIPNGVDVPVSPPRRPARTPRIVLFLSRIHPKKGLVHLVDAWAALRPTGWELWIAGPDEGGHTREVRARADRTRIAASLRFLGPIYGDARASALERAEFLVLPTLSENFGLVVAEALAVGLPVLTTTAAPWRALVNERCGWWVEPTVAGLAEGLRTATTATPDTLRSLGDAGHAFARRALGWEEVGRRMRAAYDALLVGGRCPDVRVEAELPAEDA